MKILVGGGSGYIGQHLKRLLERNGHEMVTVSRKARTPADVTWDQIRQTGLPTGFDSVVNLAGANIAAPVRWTSEYKNEVVTSRVESTGLLCKAIKEAKVKPRSFVSTSAVGYYGCEDRGEPVDEDSAPGDGFLADLCIQWEKSVDLSGTDVRPVILRIGLAISRDSKLFSSSYWPMFFGVGGTLGSGKQWFPWIHALDVARLILYSIERETVTGVLNAVAPDRVTNGDFTRQLSQLMWRFAPFSVPKFALSQLFGEERAEMMVKSPLVIPRRTAEVGFEFVFGDLRSACQDCVKWGSY